jgi:hypothetical protein
LIATRKGVNEVINAEGEATLAELVLEAAGKGGLARAGTAVEDDQLNAHRFETSPRRPSFAQEVAGEDRLAVRPPEAALRAIVIRLRTTGRLRGLCGCRVRRQLAASERDAALLDEVEQGKAISRRISVVCV